MGQIYTTTAFLRTVQASLTPDNPNPQTESLVLITFDGFDPEITVLRFSERQTVTFELDMLSSTITNYFVAATSYFSLALSMLVRLLIAHVPMAFTGSRKELPISVKLYSTLGGIVGW